MFKTMAVLIALIGVSGIVRAEDGGWKSVQITFSHRRVANGSTEIDWHSEKTATTAKQAILDQASHVRRQCAMNVGKIASHALHYKNMTTLAELQKESR